MGSVETSLRFSLKLSIYQCFCCFDFNCSHALLLRHFATLAMILSLTTLSLFVRGSRTNSQPRHEAGAFTIAVICPPQAEATSKLGISVARSFQPGQVGSGEMAESWCPRSVRRYLCLAWPVVPAVSVSNRAAAPVGLSSRFRRPALRLAHKQSQLQSLSGSSGLSPSQPCQQSTAY